MNKKKIQNKHCMFDLAGMFDGFPPIFVELLENIGTRGHEESVGISIGLMKTRVNE
jgi:hypothetical protein